MTGCGSAPRLFILFIPSNIALAAASGFHRSCAGFPSPAARASPLSASYGASPVSASWVFFINALSSTAAAIYPTAGTCCPPASCAQR